ncbi:rCG63042 [Rattus norvegicus]|uniref:RCG63042 n=1 Tax=Rattus norvegicus TaxID=10116 RepID=A6HUZ1_RAT|nr:rCG63042 [Rattus norvegicus]
MVYPIHKLRYREADF